MSIQRDTFAALMLEKFLVDWNKFYPRVYDYAFPAVSITGSGTGVDAQSVLNIEQDAPFVICGKSAALWTPDFEKMAAGANTPLYAPTQVIPNINAQIFDSGASAYLSNAPIPLRAYMGLQGSDAAEQAVPYMVERNTNLTASLTSFDARAFDVTLILHGFKILQRMNPIKTGFDTILEEFGRLNAAERAAVVRRLQGR